MKISEKLLKQIQDCKHRFAIIYESGRYFTYSNKENVVDAIKNFNSCYNSTITLLWDTKEGELYYSKENDKPDARNYFNHHYIKNSTKEVVYNEDEATKPIVIIQPSEIKPNTCNGYIDRKGNFYKCGFEGHRYLAEELFFSKTLEVKDEENDLALCKNYEEILEKRGWVKISASRIACWFKTGYSNEQKETLKSFIEITNLKEYEFQYHKMRKGEVLEKLEKENLFF